MIQDADWIGVNAECFGSCPAYQKEIHIQKPLLHATLSATVTGVYYAEINGVRIGDALLTPGCTAYGKRLQYQTYDITALLKTENKLTITVSTGWYGNRMTKNYAGTKEPVC